MLFLINFLLLLLFLMSSFFLFHIVDVSNVKLDAVLELSSIWYFISSLRFSIMLFLRLSHPKSKFQPRLIIANQTKRYSSIQSLTQLNLDIIQSSSLECIQSSRVHPEFILSLSRIPLKFSQITSRIHLDFIQNPSIVHLEFSQNSSSCSSKFI